MAWAASGFPDILDIEGMKAARWQEDRHLIAFAQAQQGGSDGRQDGYLPVPVPQLFGIAPLLLARSRAPVQALADLAVHGDPILRHAVVLAQRRPPHLGAQERRDPVAVAEGFGDDPFKMLVLRTGDEDVR